MIFVPIFVTVRFEPVCWVFRTEIFTFRVANDDWKNVFIFRELFVTNAFFELFYLFKILGRDPVIVSVDAPNDQVVLYDTSIGHCFLY